PEGGQAGFRTDSGLLRAREPTMYLRARTQCSTDLLEIAQPFEPPPDCVPHHVGVRMVLVTADLHSGRVRGPRIAPANDHKLPVPKCRPRTPDSTLHDQLSDVPLH